MKLYVIRLMSKLYNASFKSKTNEFVYLTIISLIISKLVSLFGQDTQSLLIFLLVISGTLSITTLRGSNNIIYSLLTKHLSMNIKDHSQYYSVDYYEDRKEVSDLFKEEFIEGILKLSRNPLCRKIKITTHKWVYDEIINDVRITSILKVEAKPHGKCKIPQEVLLLNSNESFSRNYDRLSVSAFRERDQFKIILRK